MKKIFLPVFALLCFTMAEAKEFHVCKSGNDSAEGSASAPFRTINRAARAALAGDTVTVHGGTYREWVDPVYGGESDSRRILYRSFPGDSVVIKGSEVISGWKKVKGSIWQCTIPNTLLGSDNPFEEVLKGDWLDNPQGVHRADIFLDDVSLYEVPSLEKVFTPDTLKTHRDPEGTQMVWHAVVDSLETVVYANFSGIDPNRHLTEASVRPTCFYPIRENLNYITVRGFTFTQAATRWGAPTAEQVGMVSTHWSKGWIIEDNLFRNSKCSGLTMGKEASTGNNMWTNNPAVDGALHYIEAIFNVLRKGWDKEYIGSHIVRNNEFCHCEQTGMCGSMGAVFSEIYNNDIHDIWTKRQFGGAEISGIKLHAAIDVYIHNNRIYRSQKGIWLDWMNQGSRVSCNLMYENAEMDIFCEVDHGPFIIDNNILLSSMGYAEYSDGGAFAHNIISGRILSHSDGRFTPYHLDHSTQVKGLSSCANGDHKFFNNIFCSDVMKEFENAALPVKDEDNSIMGCRMEKTPDGIYIVLEKMPTTGKMVDAERLGTTLVTRYGFENNDGTPFKADKDFFGNARPENPMAGPFEIKDGNFRIKVW